MGRLGSGHKEPMTNELVLSSTSADAYRQCAYRFYLEYVEMVPQVQNVRAAIGMAVHAAVEEYYTLRLMGLDHEHIVADHIEALEDAYETICAIELAMVAEPEENVGKAIASGQRSFWTYLEDVAPSVEPLYVEKALRIDIDGIPYSIHPDLIDDDGVVRDLKVKRSKPRDPTVYAFQQNGYAIGYRLLIGQKERDIQLDIIIRLLRDRPYYWPIRNGGPASDYAIRLFTNQLTDVANGIAKGRYPPEGLENGACRWCPVRHACRPYQEREASHARDQDES